MSKIAESYCVSASDHAAVVASAKTQTCPLLNTKCDGGGNRYSSDLVVKSPQLVSVFSSESTVRSSICSLEVGAENKNWIVCPRRVLSFERTDLNDPQKSLKDYLFLQSDLIRPFAVWKEVKLKVSNDNKSFDYTFDYVASSVRNESDLFPIGSPTIYEVMTSSTSGGNKQKRTTISQCFEDLLLDTPHEGPGINYRQVWGRMISQFFVKSIVATAWSGRTFWIIQDSLLKYIEASTGFRGSRFKADAASEVNLVSLGYKSRDGALHLSPQDISLYSGPLGTDVSDSFYSILGAPMIPGIDSLHRVLINRRPVAIYL